MLSGLLEQFVGKDVTVFLPPRSNDGMAGLNFVKGRLLQTDVEHDALLIQTSSGAPSIVNWNYAYQIEQNL